MRQGRARNFVIRRLKYEHAQLRLKKKKIKIKKLLLGVVFFFGHKNHTRVKIK